MLGDGKRREAVMLLVCAILGVAAIVLLAIGIDTQSEAIGNVFAEIEKSAVHPTSPRSSTATPIEQEATPPVSDIAEPPAPHGPAPKNGTTWITSDDYPATALNEELQGTVAIELRIDAVGRVSDCFITQSSGVAVLDETTCRLARTRALFFPARTATAERIASTWRRRVVWRLPDAGACGRDPAETCG